MKHGRKKPYTEIGIQRIPCFRCGKKSNQQWQICADKNLYRPICEECDIELNRLVLQFMGFENVEEMINDYKRGFAPFKGIIMQEPTITKFNNGSSIELGEVKQPLKGGRNKAMQEPHQPTQDWQQRYRNILGDSAEIAIGLTIGVVNQAHTQWVEEVLKMIGERQSASEAPSYMSTQRAAGWMNGRNGLRKELRKKLLSLPQLQKTEDK